MSKKKVSRLRRAKRARMHIREMEVPRLCVFRTPRHIYAQIISAAGDIVQASASSLDASVRAENKGNSEDAAKVGKMIAEKAVELGVKKVAFDRSGYQYHGRIKALADAAREGGLQF
ncbi:MAG: 50S ribosomal protein L18 [Pseudomonadales bacterium]|jgi:large subunit ribosomal protein L18|tara:strand:+ start:8323 stop:8673 length:351 start_codon:yes stop_codon:yes gene_type:complete